MRACPLLKDDNAEGKSNVHLASAGKGVDYVFLASDQTTQSANEMTSAKATMAGDAYSWFYVFFPQFH
jgi:hypothetical protein